MVMELVGKLPYDHPYRWDGTKFGSGRLWRPSDLGADLALWLDAEDVNSIVLNGTQVSQWTDKSGRGNHVVNATASTQPPYSTTGFNGKPTLQFTIANEEFLFGTSFNNFSSANDFFIGAVFEIFNATREWDMICGWRNFANNAGDAGGAPILQGMKTAVQIGYHNTDLVDTRIKVDVTTRVTKRIATIGRNGGTSGNGGSATTTATEPSQPTYITQATQTFYSAATSNFQVGGRQQSATDYGDKNISEIVGFSRNLTTDERLKLEGYFAWKWALVDKLPADHPYKTQPPFVIDPEAQKYLRAVEAVDGEPLEEGVRLAVNDFVVGCKEDGIWNAIKASAILAGARTLGGALIPLTGAAPTNFNFVGGDYDRATGLIGDGSTKYLDTNVTDNEQGITLNDMHLAVYKTETGSTGGVRYLIGANDSEIYTNFGSLITQSRGGGITSGAATDNNFIGWSRSTPTGYNYRVNSVTTAQVLSSTSVSNTNIGVFARTTPEYNGTHRLSFYSIGKSLDLAKLDARVSTLMTAIGAAV